MSVSGERAYQGWLLLLSMYPAVQMRSRAGVIVEKGTHFFGALQHAAALRVCVQRPPLPCCAQIAPPAAPRICTPAPRAHSATAPLLSCQKCCCCLLACKQNAARTSACRRAFCCCAAACAALPLHTHTHTGCCSKRPLALTPKPLSTPNLHLLGLLAEHALDAHGLVRRHFCGGL